MKVSYSKVINTIQAINSIENLPRSPKALIALSRNLDKLNKENEIYIAARKKLWAEIFGDKQEVDQNDPNVPKFRRMDQELLASEIDFQPTQFSMSDFNLENVSISPKAFNLITWLISDYNQEGN